MKHKASCWQDFGESGHLALEFSPSLLRSPHEGETRALTYPPRNPALGNTFPTIPKRRKQGRKNKDIHRSAIYNTKPLETVRIQ